MSPAITELIMIFDLLRNFLFDSDEVKVLLQLLVSAAFAEDVVKRGFVIIVHWLRWFCIKKGIQKIKRVNL